MNPSGEQGDGIPGDRAAPAVAVTRSVSSRLSSILAVGLMSVLGVGMLVWYYASMMSRQSATRTAAQETARHRAQGDAPLPPLGAIAQPVADGARRSPASEVSAEPVARDATPASNQAVAAPVISSFIPAGPLIAAGDPPTAVSSAPPVKTSAQLALERQLGAAPFAAQPGAGSGAGATAAVSPGAVHDAGVLGSLLRPTVTAAVQAEVLPSMRLLMPKGAFIDCTLETAIDSTLPGMTTCITATDTFGADGKVVLLERGTKLVGETRGQVQLGAARIFVLWNEARTPTGVVVPLASPGADELGRSGLSGEVNHHFWERFGAAMLISVLDGAVQATVQSSARAGGVIVSPTGSEGVATEALKGTASLAPSVTKAQGDRIQVMVARDLDFRSVYALRGDRGVP
jgi:type IV secretion system protein VirB10